MTPLPKRRHSTRRKGARRSSINLSKFKKLQLVKYEGSLIPHVLINHQKLTANHNQTKPPQPVK